MQNPYLDGSFVPICKYQRYSIVVCGFFVEMPMEEAFTLTLTLGGSFPKGDPYEHIALRT
jgi:hypothetical protein